MSVALYMDEQIDGPITHALRQRGVDVVTAQEDQHAGHSDDSLLDRATALNRCLVSRDNDFFTIVARRQAARAPFNGVVSIPAAMSYRAVIDDLEMIAKCSEPGEWHEKITRLPL